MVKYNRKMEVWYKILLQLTIKDSAYLLSLGPYNRIHNWSCAVFFCQDEGTQYKRLISRIYLTYNNPKAKYDGIMMDNADQKRKIHA